MMIAVEQERDYDEARQPEPLAGLQGEGDLSLYPLPILTGEYELSLESSQLNGFRTDNDNFYFLNNECWSLGIGAGSEGLFDEGAFLHSLGRPLPLVV